MKQRTHYRAVFISDWHLGFRGAQTESLLSFLKSIECETLYLVGDIIDLWAMRKKIWWSKTCNSILTRLLKMVRNGTRIVYLPGNHDEAIREFIPFALGNDFEFIDQTIHVTKNGKRFALIHGDQYDIVVGNMRWLAILGSKLYDVLLAMNSVVHFVRTKLGYHRYWSLAGYLKMKAKKAVSFVKDFETAVLLHATENECDGVICGHIHSAKLYEKDGLTYANCGDWIESLTAIVELDNGELELIHWHDTTHKGLDCH